MKAIFRKSTRILFGGLLLLVIGAAAVWISRPPDPEFEGKKLSQHLYVWARPTAPFGRRPTTAEVKELEKHNRAIMTAQIAVKELGPEAVPLLLSWLDGHEYPFQRKLTGYLRTNNIEMPFLTAPKRRLALMALQQVPQHATSGIPKLVELAIEDKERQLALSALGQILVGMEFDEQARMMEPAKADAEKLMASSDGHGNAWILERHLDPYGQIANLLNLESGSVPRQVAGAMFFRDRPVLPERVVPLLSQSLASTNRPLLESAARALGEYGSAAQSALPALCQLTNNSHRFVAIAAVNALTKIQTAKGSVPEKGN